MEQRTFANGVVCLVSPLIEKIGVRHAFSTRIGGVSCGAFASLNFGNPMGSPIRDSNESIETNYARLLDAINLADRPVSQVHQIHGNEIVTLRDGDAPARHQKADGLLSDSPQTVLSVRTADCVPILIASGSGHWVAAVHAGWRGIVVGVLPAAISELHRHGVPVDQIVVAVGPCIGPAAFEVGAEVAEEFRRVFADEAPITRKPGERSHVDLCAAAELQARRCGVPAANIDAAQKCTVAHADLFFSHRRDAGLTGRMVAVIAAN